MNAVDAGDSPVLVDAGRETAPSVLVVQEREVAVRGIGNHVAAPQVAVVAVPASGRDREDSRNLAVANDEQELASDVDFDPVGLVPSIRNLWIGRNRFQSDPVERGETIRGLDPEIRVERPD